MVEIDVQRKFENYVKYTERPYKNIKYRISVATLVLQSLGHFLVLFTMGIGLKMTLIINFT